MLTIKNSPFRRISVNVMKETVFLFELSLLSEYRCGILNKIVFYNRYDVDHSNFIDQHELQIMMEKLEAPQTFLGLKAMIKEVDEDEDGEISFREVCYVNPIFYFSCCLFGCSAVQA